MLKRKQVLALGCILIIALLHLLPSDLQAQEVSSLTGGFSASGGVTVGSDGDIYVGDYGTGPANGHQIYRITPQGDISVFATGIVGATGGRFDSAGNLYWSSYALNRVYKINSSGQATAFADVSGPVAIVVDDQDELVVCACNNNSVVRVNSQGAVSVLAQSLVFNCPNGLTRDDQGNFYVSNYNNGVVAKVTSNGSVSHFATVPGGNAVNIAYVNGFLYVTAREVHQIYRISLAGEVTLFAGTGVRGNLDGPALQARFSWPNSIGVSPDGTKLYVNDVDGLGFSFHPTILRVITLGTPVGVESASMGFVKTLYR